jgi:hypothetical protein
MELSREAALDIVHAARMGWGENLAAHRQGGMAHKVLFEGDEGSPDNFVWVMANEGADYYSPRHRHAWDQVRHCLEGSIPISRDLRIDAGEVGYFPEGVPYGPQEGGPNRLTLVLQIGGASGLGYLSARQLRVAREALSREGVFEGGVFSRTSGEGKKNLDAYEAIWRHVTGRPIDYPEPRYKAPVILRPRGFGWREVEGVPGVRRKLMASFAERGLDLEFLALDPGADWRFPAAAERRLVFVRSGQGVCDETAYESHSAIRIEPGTAAGFTATAATELFVITLALVANLPQACGNSQSRLDFAP